MTETILAMRVWTGDTKDGRERFDLIGARADGHLFRGSTLNAWIASLWNLATQPRTALIVTWEKSADGRFTNVTHVEQV